MSRLTLFTLFLLSFLCSLGASRGVDSLAVNPHSPLHPLHQKWSLIEAQTASRPDSLISLWQQEQSAAAKQLVSDSDFSLNTARLLSNKQQNVPVKNHFRRRRFGRFRRVTRVARRAARTVTRTATRTVTRTVRTVTRTVRNVVRAPARVVRSLGKVGSTIVKKAKKVVKQALPIIKAIAINYIITAVPVAGQIYAAYQLYKTIENPREALLNIAKTFVAQYLPPEVTNVINKAMEYKKQFEEYKQIIKNPKAFLQQYGAEFVGQISQMFDLQEIDNLVAKYKEVETTARQWAEVIKDPKQAIKTLGQPIVQDLMEKHASPVIKKVQEVTNMFHHYKQEFKDMQSHLQQHAASLVQGIVFDVSARVDQVRAEIHENLQPVLNAVEHVKSNLNRKLSEFEEKVTVEVIGVMFEELTEVVARLDGQIADKLERAVAALKNNAVLQTANGAWVSLKAEGKEILNEVRAIVHHASTNSFASVGRELRKIADKLA
jgi:virulence-associated protein VapD